MAEPKEKPAEEKPAQDKKTTKKATKQMPNTMKIGLVSSAGAEINITGYCSDKEIKAVCKALIHTEDQKFEVKEQG